MAADVGTVLACHTKADFDTKMAEAKEAGKLVVIDFTASWCGPCRIMAPIFAEYSKKYPAAIFLKVDVDELKEVAEEYKIEAMPTFMFIKDGKKVHTVLGGRKDEIESKIQELLSETDKIEELTAATSSA